MRNHVPGIRPHRISTQPTLAVGLPAFDSANLPAKHNSDSQSTCIVSTSQLAAHLGGGLARSVARLDLHARQQRVALRQAARAARARRTRAHQAVLQRGDVLERVEGDHAVVVVAYIGNWSFRSNG
jgi:hypothetical protein